MLRWLEAGPGNKVVLDVPERAKTSNWQWWTSGVAFEANEGHWLSTRMNYRHVTSLSGTQVSRRDGPTTRLWGPGRKLRMPGQ